MATSLEKMDEITNSYFTRGGPVACPECHNDLWVDGNCNNADCPVFGKRLKIFQPVVCFPAKTSVKEEEDES